MTPHSVQPAILIAGLDREYRAALEEQLSSLAWHSMAVQSDNELREALNLRGYDIVLLDTDRIDARDHSIFSEAFETTTGSLGPSVMVTSKADSPEHPLSWGTMVSYVPKPRAPQGYLAPMIREILDRTRSMAEL